MQNCYVKYYGNKHVSILGRLMLIAHILRRNGERLHFGQQRLDARLKSWVKRRAQILHRGACFHTLQVKHYWPVQLLQRSSSQRKVHQAVRLLAK